MSEAETVVFEFDGEDWCILAKAMIDALRAEEVKLGLLMACKDVANEMGELDQWHAELNLADGRLALMNQAADRLVVIHDAVHDDVELVVTGKPWATDK